jgi:hypothetical protein
VVPLDAWQTPAASQQPVGHEAAVQVHAPPTHDDPIGHVGPVPHVHVPAAEQPSLRVELQVVHTAPAVPHEAVLAGLQMPPAQHPDGHDVALQTQEPPTQTWPAAHAPLVPQVHVPAELQVSPVVPQSMHDAPLVPQVAVPLVRHTSPSQQPVAQLVASQMHFPPEHRWPAVHAAPVPHLHAPAAQVSAVAGSHAVQTVPAAPHAVNEMLVHTPPRQQPVVHDERQTAESPLNAVSVVSAVSAVSAASVVSAPPPSPSSVPSGAVSFVAPSAVSPKLVSASAGGVESFAESPESLVSLPTASPPDASSSTLVSSPGFSPSLPSLPPQPKAKSAVIRASSARGLDMIWRIIGR